MNSGLFSFLNERNQFYSSQVYFKLRRESNSTSNILMVYSKSTFYRIISEKMIFSYHLVIIILMIIMEVSRERDKERGWGGNRELQQ